MATHNATLELTFGERLQVLRKRAGITQPAIADLLNVHTNTVINWERGHAFPASRKQYGRLANLLGVDVEALDPGGELRNKCSDNGPA